MAIGGLGPSVDLALMSNAMKVRGLFSTQSRQFYVSRYLLDKIRKTAGTVKLGGRVMEVPLETRGVASFGGQFEHEQVSDPDAPGYEYGTVNIATLTAAFQISLQAHLASNGEQLSFVEAKIASMSSLVEQFAMNMSRTCWGDGTGAIARVLSVAADTPVAGQHTIVLEPDQGASADFTFGPKFIIRGMRLSAATIKVGTTPDVDADLQVISVTKTTNTIVVKGSLGAPVVLAATHYLFIGSKARTSMGRMPLGVFNAIDNGTIAPVYLGINRTGANARDYWNAYVVRNVLTADLEKEIQKSTDEVHSNVGGVTDIMLMSLGVWRRFANDLRSERQFITAADTGRYRAGTKMIAYEGAGENTIAIGRDRDVPAGTITGFDWSTWFLGELLPAGWLQAFDEKGIFRQIGGTLDWEAVYAWMGQLICNKPAANWIMREVTEA
jgi:hypothetical protein